jgi:hypothetical protein
MNWTGVSFAQWYLKDLCAACGTINCPRGQSQLFMRVFIAHVSLGAPATGSVITILRNLQQNSTQVCSAIASPPTQPAFWPAAWQEEGHSGVAELRSSDDGVSEVVPLELGALLGFSKPCGLEGLGEGGGGRGAMSGWLNRVGWMLKDGTLGAEVVTIGRMHSGVIVLPVRCIVTEVYPWDDGGFEVAPLDLGPWTLCASS